MTRFLPIAALLLLGTANAANADITHKLQSSVQLTVNAAATQATRMGNTFSTSGSNVTTTYNNGTADVSAVAKIGVGSDGQFDVTAITASQATAGEAYSYSASYTAGDTIVTSAPATGAVSAYSNQITAAGTADDLAGSVTSKHGFGTLTAGGAGTSVTGQFVTELTIR